MASLNGTVLRACFCNWYARVCTGMRGAHADMCESIAEKIQHAGVAVIVPWNGHRTVATTGEPPEHSIAVIDTT